MEKQVKWIVKPHLSLGMERFAKSDLVIPDRHLTCCKSLVILQHLRQVASRGITATGESSQCDRPEPGKHDQREQNHDNQTCGNAHRLIHH